MDLINPLNFRHLLHGSNRVVLRLVSKFFGIGFVEHFELSIHRINVGDGGSASVNASAVPKAYATTPPPVTANASAAASTAAAVTAGAVTGPEPRFDVPTTITLLHAGLLQLRATIHQLGYVTGHPSHGYVDAYAQQALQTHVTDLVKQVATLKEHGLHKDTDKDA